MEQYSGYWESEMNRAFKEGHSFDVREYHDILSPDFPDFLLRYIRIPLLQRLDGIGLLCGTDWTKLFNNRIYYSRLDHSIGTALIVWNFTHSKCQTLAALFHDVSTPVFSHVVDFKNGDALNQESTENLTEVMINQDEELNFLLKSDGVYQYEMRNYHMYPIADNDMPQLSADRLEYMYPSGAALCAKWSTSEIKENYNTIRVYRNEKGEKELGFSNEDQALIYTEKFCDISLLLQHNEDKIAMQLMADIITKAIESGFINENDLYTMSESSIIELFDKKSNEESDKDFTRMYYTYRNMTQVIHSEKFCNNAYNVRLDVKKRYVNPLVGDEDGNVRGRIYSVNDRARKIIDDFKDFEDTKYGCTPWLK